MKLKNVNVRVIKVNTVDGGKLDEVFITCDEPYLNFVMHLSDAFAGNIENGIYDVDFSPSAPAIKKVEMKSDLSGK